MSETDQCKALWCAGITRSAILISSPRATNLHLLLSVFRFLEGGHNPLFFCQKPREHLLFFRILQVVAKCGPIARLINYKVKRVLDHSWRVGVRQEA